MKNHVEVFYEYDAMKLKGTINKYCKNHNYNPVSMSVIWSAGTYVAFVVVEEGDQL